MGLKKFLHECPAIGWSRSGFHGLLRQTDARRCVCGPYRSFADRKQ